MSEPFLSTNEQGTTIAGPECAQLTAAAALVEIQDGLANLARLSRQAGDLASEPGPIRQAEWDAIIERAHAEAAAMAERHAGSPEVASFQMSDTVTQRLRLLTDVYGVETPILYGGEPDSYVETFLGVDAQGRQYYTVHDHMGKDASLNRLPDSLVIQEGSSTIVYDITEDGVISPLNDPKGVVEQRIQLFERLGGLNAHLAERAAEAAKDELPLQLRIPLMLQGENVTEFPYVIEGVVVTGTEYHTRIYGNGTSYAVQMTTTGPKDSQQTTRLYVPKDRQSPTFAQYVGRGTQEIERVVHSILDRKQGIVIEPKSEYDAALQLVSGLMDDDPDTEFAPWREPHLNRRVITIRGVDHRLFKVEQINDATVERPIPYTRVTITDVDPDSGKETSRGEFRLTEEGFEPLATGRRKILARWLAGRRFNSFAHSLLQDPTA